MFGLIVMMIAVAILLLLVLPWAEPYLERVADWLEADPVGSKIGGWYDRYLSWVGKKQRLSQERAFAAADKKADADRG